MTKRKNPPAKPIPFCVIAGVQYDIETEDAQRSMADWFFTYYSHPDSSDAAESLRSVLEWNGYEDVGTRTYILAP